MSYPPIGDYALIGDCHSSALVSRDGSIDWCCTPRLDSPSVFGRLLDRERGGFCSIGAEGAETSRRYVNNSLVLETTFRAGGGEARLYDFFAMRRGGRDRPYRQLIRIVEGVRGRVELDMRASPRFDYGEVQPWFRREGAQLYSAIGGAQGLLFASDFPMERVDRHNLAARIIARAGERARLSIRYVEPELLDEQPAVPPEQHELDGRLDETLTWWEQWASEAQFDGPYVAGAIRSAAVLKALTFAPTGAIAAAPTASLPALIPGDANWDYRYSWVRDSTFTVRALFELGYEKEPEGFRRFVERSAAGTGTDIQVVYGIGGERRLTEIQLEDLEGYRGCAPVRIGNDAWRQEQLDVYGEAMDLAWRWYERGRSPDDDYWEFIVDMVDSACEHWTDPDRGIWEVRGEPRHFVHSKVMCWTAVDRALKLAEASARRAPTDRWERMRKEIREAIDGDGYDDKRGVFVREFGSRGLDASLLLIPGVDFCAYDDDRMMRTADAIAEELGVGGLLRRYAEDDGVEEQGAFLPCSFWLAEVYARQGRKEPARAWFDRTVATANDLGLFSEQFDVDARELRGNFPQGLTHLSHIAAAVALSENRLPSATAG
ncbi:MAG: glycoside hydrolase family 15 protein [Actinobacteria bacterium]|nr:MAG: glycoside hydrolase family 15 protein [Actinomycetota bacterium]